MRENYDAVSRKCLTIDVTCLLNEGFVDLEDIIKFEKCTLNFSVSVFANVNESVYKRKGISCRSFVDYGHDHR